MRFQSIFRIFAVITIIDITRNNQKGIPDSESKTNMKRLLNYLASSAIALLCSMTAQAQEKLTAELYGDFVSSYIWRGMEQCKASVQPALQLNYRGLELELWGSYELAGSGKYKEIDITLYYNLANFKFKVQDVWCGEGGDPEGRYFKYDAHATNHFFEASVGYDFGPVWMEWNTVFAGNDGLNNSGKRAYSSYFIADVPFRLAGCDWTASLGVVPYATTFYMTTGFAVTNVELKVSKDIKVTDSFSIPVFADLVANPRLQQAFFVFGFTLKP